MRRGVVLIAVLVVVTLLSLAAYQYSDMMNSESRAAYNAHRAVQARSLAASGIWSAAALLSNPDNVNNALGGNLWNNSSYFFDQAVPSSDGATNFGRYTLIAPMDASSTNISQGCRYGPVDEGSKINPNVLMLLDPSGTRLFNALMTLPNMTTQIANSIIDWIDPDNTPRDGGAEDDYYMGLNPPYHCKNRPLESIEELLYVQGVTPALLFGRDFKRSGIIDPGEDDGSGPYAFGWAQFLTVYSRELNADPSGNALFNVNDSDIQTLYTNLSANVNDSLAKFIILYRQYGGSSTTKTSATQMLAAAAAAASGSDPNATTPSATTPNTSSSSTTTSSGVKTQSTTTPSNATPNAAAQPTGDVSSVDLDFTKAAKGQLASMWELIGATVTVPSTQQGQPPVVYASPLSDPSTQAALLPLLFSTCTIFQTNEVPARINVNTAPPEVLNSIPELSTDDVQSIVTNRPDLTSSEPPDPMFQTPAWLLTQAKLDPAVLMLLDNFITTRSQVFRVQSVGYIDDNGPTARIEAVIDANAGRPRILMWRDLTPLGKGWSKPQ